MAVISSLNGYEKNDVNIKNAVYRVKNDDNTDTYSRIHFETSSKMVHDATDAATGNMVARRDSFGGIKFVNIESSGTADINILKVKDTNVVLNLNADRVDNCHVSDTTTTNTNLWTASKVDTTKANKTISISGAGGLTGGGTLEANRTISHATQTVPTPSSLGTEPSKTTNNVIASLTVTNLGHVTGIRTTDLDQRYPTKTQVATDIANAGLAVSRDLIAKSPSNRSDNGNNLIMQNFTMQYNSTTQSIDFVFA